MTMEKKFSIVLSLLWLACLSGCARAADLKNSSEKWYVDSPPPPSILCTRCDTCEDPCAPPPDAPRSPPPPPPLNPPPAPPNPVAQCPPPPPPPPSPSSGSNAVPPPFSYILPPPPPGASSQPPPGSNSAPPPFNYIFPPPPPTTANSSYPHYPYYYLYVPSSSPLFGLRRRFGAPFWGLVLHLIIRWIGEARLR